MACDSDIPATAAKAWAQAHALGAVDPVTFGHDVARVYLATEQTLARQGNERITAAVSAALSIPPEVWQSLTLLLQLARPTPGNLSEVRAPVGAE